MSNVAFELWVKEQLEEIIRRLPKQQDNIAELVDEAIANLKTIRPWLSNDESKPQTHDNRVGLAKAMIEEYRATHFKKCDCRACRMYNHLISTDK